MVVGSYSCTLLARESLLRLWFMAGTIWLSIWFQWTSLHCPNVFSYHFCCSNLHLVLLFFCGLVYAWFCLPFFVCYDIWLMFSIHCCVVLAFHACLGYWSVLVTPLCCSWIYDISLLLRICFCVFSSCYESFRLLWLFLRTCNLHGHKGKKEKLLNHIFYSIDSFLELFCHWLAFLLCLPLDFLLCDCCAGRWCLCFFRMSFFVTLWYLSFVSLCCFPFYFYFSSHAFLLMSIQRLKLAHVLTWFGLKDSVECVCCCCKQPFPGLSLVTCFFIAMLVIGFFPLEI